MINSIRRKTLLVALAIAVPPALTLWAYTGSGGLWRALAAAIPGLIAVVILATTLTRQVGRCTSFVRRILDPSAPRTHLDRSNDELGALAQALNDVTPKIHEVVNRLSVELTRREAILAGLIEGVLAVDAKLNITFCNRAFVNAIGDPVAAEGLPLIKVVRDPGLFEALKEVVDSGAAVYRRVQLSVQDGRTYEIHAAPLPSPSSRGAIAILHDLTPSERLDRIRRDFIANVSHEFRTPLATIRGYAETLLDGALEDIENRRKFVEAIFANSVRLNNIAADLLTLSEIEGGRPDAEASLISVGELIQSTVRALEPAASLAGVRIEVQEIQDCYVRGHRTRMEQAIVNLVDNAVKFNRPDGEVRIRLVAPSEKQVEISVSDTGPGIPRECLGRIFERFYRVDKARSRQVGGTGLGLSIVKHAVEQMNGKVEVESELGVGSRFTILLPRCNVNSQGF